MTGAQWATWFISSPALPRVCMTPPPGSAPSARDWEHDRREINRILAMTDVEIGAEFRSKAIDLRDDRILGCLARAFERQPDPPGAA